MKVMVAALVVAVSLPPAVLPSSQAGSATWNLDPPDSSWNIATDWTPATVPNGPGDTATFGLSNQSDILVEAANPLEVNGLVFDVVASGITILVFWDHFLCWILTIHLYRFI